ncbi:serine hydrolase domain-containing protein [Lacibacter sediminis]|uniref:Beta-lactamase family protein n=1 Tax=Lacibacter sediminis TaxID=2760713 RepID=A0A7G5XCD6_9BACT|nr:serine hydrolase domain-containing protein [Lacibacter sediminis]QNA43139.1 beta-lactamase family protein [Lacibacter sediminis]
MRSFLCFILLLGSLALNAQQLDEIDRFVSKQVQDQMITGLSIGIIVNGKIVLAKGYGLANVEHKIPASQKTVYKIGSLSKQFVAVGIMTLIQSGKIKLTDTVTKYFKDAPATWGNITIRHLLNHTSGLVRESPAFLPMLVQHDTVLIKAAYKMPLVFATGTKWQYCNLGYFMLADIIRQVSGKPFPEFMQEEVFSKQGLNIQATSTRMIVPERADGYVLAGKDSLYNATDYIAFRPSGAFISSITDMLKWEILMQDAKLLSKENWQQMWTDTVKTGVISPKVVYYGYGWNVTDFKSRLLVNHGGSLPGFRSIYYRFPSDRTAVIILTNSDHTNAGVIAQGISEILYKD